MYFIYAIYNYRIKENVSSITAIIKAYEIIETPNNNNNRYVWYVKENMLNAIL